LPIKQIQSAKTARENIKMMMNFLKKNWLTLLLTAFLLAILLIPSFKEFVTRQILMKPSLEKVENEVTFSPEELNLQLKGVNVPDANLADFKGKVVFLNFWGTWCPPCRAEFPTIQKLYDAKKDKVQFVLIAMQDEEAKVKEFLAENKYTTPVYLANSLIAEKMLPKSFPTTFLIAKNGRILMKEDAAKDWNSTDVQQFIDSVSK